MVLDTKSFDGDLQMFRDAPGVANLAQLRLQRWLIDHGRSEHPPAGPPAGDLVDVALASRSTTAATE